MTRTIFIKEIISIEKEPRLALHVKKKID